MNVLRIRIPAISRRQYRVRFPLKPIQYYVGMVRNMLSQNDLLYLLL